ncbi:MAG: U32 family peptidase [Pseudanabaenaceae cyanobacterium bins.68]|nr:U32 family peptidase [Pseudanabaenaceae cyanobacterium bins.68]
MTRSNPSGMNSVALSKRCLGMTRLPELLAPAGNWLCARAAVENGADAIYFGLEKFNARLRSDNFTEPELPALVAFLHERGVKAYVTLNTLIFSRELEQLEQYLRSIIIAGVDAVIVQDIGLCRLIRHLSPDLPIHASTQMTISSRAGVEFAEALGCEVVVLARECSLKQINQIQTQTQAKLEVFVHGALCVAYSGQCLTSESLGGRSANRGECAQACRMVYQLIADGKEVNLGDRQYLLSPQDLAGLAVLPELVRTGVSCLKIEGRLKSPEYVATVTRTYRAALDRIAQALPPEQGQDQYNLEMAFSRGLYPGWFEGIDHQKLVHGRYAKKRGVYLGEVSKVEGDRLYVQLKAPLKPGDGVVFDSEEGGRVYQVEVQGEFSLVGFGKHGINWQKVRPGCGMWKTSDPALDRQVRQTYRGESPQFAQPLDLEVHGVIGQVLTLIGRDRGGHVAQVQSSMPLVAAQVHALATEQLRKQLGRLGQTPFYLARLENHLESGLILPVSELNHLRRSLVEKLLELRRRPQVWQLHRQATYRQLLPTLEQGANHPPVQLTLLVRDLSQLAAAISAGISVIYCEFEDPRHYRQAVKLGSDREIILAPPRISKPQEQWILDQMQAANPSGYLIRNYDHLKFLTRNPDQKYIGDFSLNLANPLSAQYLMAEYPLARLTASYDLNFGQLQDLLQTSPPTWWEVTVHQHIPMFHMEHCVFCAFLSEGTDYTNCGRPCEKHEVKLRDRAGVEHPLKADAGCRNTLYNGMAQTAAEHLPALISLGVRYLRLEFLTESAIAVSRTIAAYEQLLNGKITGAELWQTLKRQTKINNQMGVTRGAIG